MRQRHATRAGGYLSRGALISLLLHLNVVAPLVVAAFVYGAREEAQRAEEVDVGFEDATAAELPADLPPIEPMPEPLEPEKHKPEPKRKPESKPKLAENEVKKKKDEKAPDKKLAKKEKPEPEVIVPPLPPMPPPPPPPPRGHEKMVDLDNGKDVPPPPDAKYLAQKNNRAEVETRATDTNLDRAQQGQAQASAPSERTDDQVGGEKAKIAQLEDQKSALGRAAPAVTPHVNPELAETKPEVEPSRRSLLALRDPAPRQHELTPETADLSLPRTPDGDIPLPSRAVRGSKSDPARVPAGKRVKLALSGADYEYISGADAEAERRLGQKALSTKQGKFQQKQARIRAALENFIPEVRPGNQTQLNTRAAPFAAYIARMHRSIHQLWGFGQLEDWDDKAGTSPFNNRNLLTTLELVLNGDGTIDKVTIVKASGYLPYDVAAIDVAYNAGPYPDPPREIRSKNGKIYIHWRFYRDERQCATSGVDYYILDNAPKAGDTPAVAEAPEPPAARATGAAGGASPRPAAAPNLIDPPAPRRLQHLDRPVSGAKMARLDAEVAAAEAEDTAGGAPSRAESSPAIPLATDAVARGVAERWLAALAAGDGGRLADLAAIPFKTSGKDVTRKSDLASMLAELAGEGVRRGSSIRIYSAAGLRAAIGKLPPNIDDGSGTQLYAMMSGGGHDTLILVLGQRGGTWKAIGLVRR